MLQALHSIDWPNVLTATILAALVAATGYCCKAIINYSIARRSLIQYGRGIWFSAEYDPKGSVPKSQRVTYLRVEAEPLFRGAIRIRSLEQLNSEAKSIETAWILEGRIEQGVLIGEWRTSVKGTVRFGTAILRFLDNGRAVGYWIGVRGFDPPVYGFWILSRNLDDLREIVRGAVPPGTFDMIDVGRRVADFERGTRGSRI